MVPDAQEVILAVPNPDYCAPPCALIRSKPGWLGVTLQQGLDMIVRRDDAIAWSSADYDPYSIEAAAQLDAVLDGLRREELEAIAEAAKCDPQTLRQLIELSRR